MTDADLRQNSIIEILTRMANSQKSSWLTLRTIQSMTDATQEDMNALVAKGLIKTSDEIIGFAIV